MDYTIDAQSTGNFLIEYKTGDDKNDDENNGGEDTKIKVQEVTVLASYIYHR